MNKRIFADVKVNTRRIAKTPEIKEDVPFVDSGNHNPSRPISYLPPNDSSRYEFLNKINKKTASISPRISQTPQMPRRGKSFSKKILFVFILVIIFGACYLLSTVYLSAKVTVVAKNKTFDLKNQKFTASKLKSSGIPFELMIVEDKDYKDVLLTNSKEVSEKAKGEITLFNEYSNKVQKITAETFISDEKGKTYKFDSTVSIPGYTEDKAKKITPGQVTASVTAFLPGEAYNGNPESFSVNSFKGTDKFKKIYGKAKTSISGGMTGLVFLLGEEEKADLLLKTSTSKEKLLRKLSAQVPQGYLLYPDAVGFTYELGENTVSKTPDAKIEMKGTLSAVLIKESELSNAIINKLLPNISEKERGEILDPKLSDLAFDFVDKNQSINKEVENFDFELTGNIYTKWSPNTLELRDQLVSKEKNNVVSIFKQDPGILSAGVSVIPFWSKKLPDNVKNIKIILK